MNKVQRNIILVVIIILLCNYLADRFFFRLDFTADGRYTLSQATKNILSKLDEPVTVSAYFSEGLRPDFTKIKEDFKDILIEYASLSGGNVVFEFIDPGEDEQVEREAMMNGIQPVLINERKKDKISQRKAYMGAVIQIGDQKESIPFIQQDAPTEYMLSSSIKKLTVLNKPVVGMVRGHGEPTLGAIQQALVKMSVLNEIQAITMVDTGRIDDRFKTILIVAPTDTIPQSHLAQFDDFLARGGRMLVAINRVEADLNRSTGRVLNTGLEIWLRSKGIQVEENFIIDANCGSVMITQQLGPIPFQTPVQFPYLPMIADFADHPITKGLERVMLRFASSISFISNDTSIRVTTLARTSGKSGTENANTMFDVGKRWENSDFTQSSLPVAAALEGKLVGNVETKMVIIADGDFIIG
ncbi:MAG: GldG family protein, partial [Bacteroidetes bacterium]|nr:GldG family protein [Bacteroidota bacterium]